MLASNEVLSATDDLEMKLVEIDLRLERQVLRLRAARLLTEDQFRGLYISDDQVDALLSPRGEGTHTVDELTRKIAKIREARQSSGELPLVRIAVAFGLSDFEVDVLVIAVAPELDAKYSTLYAYAQNDVTRKAPTVDLALSLLCSDARDRWSKRECFLPSAPLFRSGLLRLVDDAQDRDPSLLSRYVKADARVVDEILGRSSMDSRLTPFTTCETPAISLESLALPSSLLAALSRVRVWREPPGGFVVVFSGARGTGRLDAARALCTARRLRLLVVDLARAAPVDPGWSAIPTLVSREATLHGAAVYLRHFDVSLGDEAAARSQRLTLINGLESFKGVVFIETEGSRHEDGDWRRPAIRFEFMMPKFPLRLRIWKEELARSGRADLEAEQLAAKFALSPGEIRGAVRRAEQSVRLAGKTRADITSEDLHTAAREQSTHMLHRLGRKIETAYAWRDIVLPPRSREQLEEVRAAVQHRHTVLSKWAFERRLGMAEGVNILFSGPSGTGKTMAASIIACELGLELWRIDLASVVSKYIGETEKNLSRVFQEARSSNAILFFDEADALFGRRSEVKDAHDRYANIEVAFLLQQMESYDGVVILATNLSRNVDDAFTRRMHHIVEFPLPDMTSREQIWRGMFPPTAPLSEAIDFGFLARHFEMTGGNIRNAVFSAAIAAASRSEPIGMHHLIFATARELQKMGKAPAASQFREYYDMVRDRV